MDISNTGERILLEKETPLMIARHRCAYEFSRDYASGKRVLDIGCGEGYGSYYLAEFAKDVVGIDRSQDAIGYARDKYRKVNLEFKVVDIKELGNFKQDFDLICSFQVIEHLEDTDYFLSAVSSLLSEGGIFICSTPNKLDASPNSPNPHNKFHVREYLFDEFGGLLKKHFGKVKIYGLKRSLKLRFYRRLKKAGLFNFLPDYVDPVKRFYGRADCSCFVVTEDSPQDALDFIAVCGK